MLLADGVLVRRKGVEPVAGFNSVVVVNVTISVDGLTEDIEDKR